MSFPVPAGSSDLQVPLMNLSTVSKRLDSLHQLLSESVKTNTVISQIQMDMVSSEISSAIQNTIINGAALLACSSQSTPDPPPPKISTELKPIEKYREKEPSPSPPPPPPQSSLSQMKNESDCDLDGGDDVIELDAVELLAEHVHFCSVCGKGFKRDANLRMHMRAHGNQFKTAEALAKPKDDENLEEKKKKKARFSCPYEGCNRNREHSKFKALKSVICVRNHFKRSHCPKTYTCSRCNKKNFSVEADLRSHFKHCGELRWKCTCGTSFSRKDKLFGHMALFEGHMPAAREEEGGGEEMKMMVQQEEEDGNGDEGLLFDDGFGSMEDVLEYPASTDWQREMSLFCGFGQ